jgi:hypothetical protein
MDPAHRRTGSSGAPQGSHKNNGEPKLAVEMPQNRGQA